MRFSLKLLAPRNSAQGKPILGVAIACQRTPERNRPPIQGAEPEPAEREDTRNGFDRGPKPDTIAASDREEEIVSGGQVMAEQLTVTPMHSGGQLPQRQMVFDSAGGGGSRLLHSPCM